MTEELGERQREVLRAVVQEYIATGDPVGSQQLLQRGEFEVSSATLRNVMADLEELGFLEKPHTSAGRVPTDRAYRFFVDTLVKLRDPAPRDRDFIQQGISPIPNAVEDTLQDASRVLHSLSRHAAVVLTPRPRSTVLQRVEFVRLREDRVLAILIGQGGQVQNKVLTVDFPVTSDELIRAANYLSELLRQLPLEEVRLRLLQELEQDRADYDALATKALTLGLGATDITASERVLIEGTGSLLETPEFSDVERMRNLLRALDEKHKLLQLCDRVQRAKEMQIFIGAESDFSRSGDVTVIVSPYAVNGIVLGTVGVIGPTRMNYQRIIPLVSFTAQVLGRALDS